MVTAEAPEEQVSTSELRVPEGEEPRRVGRVERIILVSAVVASVPFYLFFARKQWFWGGEWSFLATRQLTSVHDLLRPYHQHWETIPVIIFQLLFLVFRIRSYVPYQLPVIMLHALAGFLLWIVIRRSGVRPWLAIITAIAFVYFGHGRQDIVLAFQLGFDSALVLGLCAVLLIDHPGRANRRDVLAAICSVLALLCSGVAVPMIVIAAIVMFVRRGIKPALLYVAPLTAMYLAWYFTIARTDYAGNTFSSPGAILGFVGSALADTLDALGSNPVAAVALAGLVLSGLLVAWWSRAFDAKWTLPLAFGAGALAFLVITAYGRASSGTGSVDQSRYVDIAACLLLPLLAKSADLLTRKYRYATPIVAAIVLVGVPSNLAAAGPSNGSTGDRQALVALATSPMAESVDGSHVADVFRFPTVSVHWLLTNVGRSGLPAGTAVDQPARAAADIRLQLEQIGLQRQTRPCQWLTGHDTVFLHTHDDISFLGSGVVVSASTPDGVGNVLYPAIPDTNGSTLRATSPIAVTLHSAGRPVQVCSRATSKKG